MPENFRFLTFIEDTGVISHLETVDISKKNYHNLAEQIADFMESRKGIAVLYKPCGCVEICYNNKPIFGEIFHNSEKCKNAKKHD